MNPGLLLAVLNDPAFAQEPDAKQAPEVPCVNFAVDPDPKLDLKSYQRAEQIMGALFPFGAHPEKCLEARVSLHLDKDGAADLSLTATAPAHRMQNPEAARDVQPFDKETDLGVIPVKIQTKPDWVVQYARLPEAAQKELALDFQAETALSSALQAPAAELKENLQTWLQVNAESMGPLRDAKRYELRSLGRGNPLVESEGALRQTLEGMSDPDEGAAAHNVEVQWLRAYDPSDFSIENGVSCQRFPGDARVAEVVDATSGRKVPIIPEGACTTKEELRELAEAALVRLTEPEQPEAPTPPQVKVMVMWPKHATPGQQEIWTTVIEQAAVKASAYVARNYLPQKELPPVINLHIDFNSSSRAPLAVSVATDVSTEVSKLSVEKPIENHSESYFVTIKGGGARVLVPFHSFEGDLDGNDLRPGFELDSDRYVWKSEAFPQKVSKEELAQAIAAGMIQSLSPWVGPNTETSLAWPTSRQENTTGGTSADGQKAAIDAGFDHICTEFDVGDDGRSLSVGANWRGMLPIGVEAINKEGKGDPCTPEVGLTFNVLGLDVTVGTSKEEK